MKYKLIVCDYDDTLATTKHRVSEKSIRIINEYRRRGGLFTLATGRSHISAIQALEQFGFDSAVPVISNQGALIQDSHDGTVYLNQRVRHGLAHQFVKDMEKRKMYLQLYNGDICMRNSTSDFTEFYAKATGITPILQGSFTEYMSRDHSDIQKIMVIAEPEVIAGIIEEFRPEYPELTMQITSPYMLEVYSAKAGKGAAAKFLAEEILGISRDAVMAFGDSPNDISMIKYAGMGVAVKNAHPDVIAAADGIAGRHDEDGVALFIEKTCFCT